MSRIILDCFSTLFSEAGSQSLSVTHMASVTSQLALVHALSLTTEAGILGVCHTHLAFI